MMGGSRGTEASVLEGLIAFGKDPKAMAGRLEQLKAAQDAAQERIAKAAEVEAANAKRVDELDALMAELDKRKVALDKRETLTSNGEASLKRRNDALLHDVDKLKAERDAFANEQRQVKANLATERASLDRLAANIDQQQIELQDRIKGCAEREADLANGKAALDADKDAFASRQEALKAALAGV